MSSALIAGVTPADAQEVGYSVSASIAQGTYPGSELSGSYVFNSVDVTAGPVRFWASVPFIRRSSTFDTIDVVTGDPASVDQTSTGWGDPLVRVDVQLHNDRTRALQIGVAACVKPSLVDAAGGLGTGATDVGVGGSLFKGFGRASFFADLVFWKYGDPEGVEFQDSLAYSAGLGRVIGTGRWSAMVSISGFSSGVDGVAAPLQLNLSALALAGRRQSVAITAGIGLTDSASDLSVGTSWRTSF